jgi:serine/threonine protein kinase
MELLRRRKSVKSKLPPIIFLKKSYNIRKIPRNHPNSVRTPNTRTNMVNSAPPDKIPIESSQESQIFTLNLQDIELGKCLGRGKGGRVVIGSTEFKDYAIKIIPKDLEKYAKIESKILGLVNSDFIIRYYGILEDNQNFYLVLELINGLDLFHTIRNKKPKQKEIISICAQVLLGLEAIHSNGVVYRDLKPENIMIDINYKVKFIDFGLSKVVENERTLTVCGSPEYMAPELIRKTPYSYAVDFWGFGVLVYELLCG